MTRRELLYSSAASALTAKVSGAFSIGEVFAQSRAWDQGELVHVLPTVSHDRLLIKASFKTPLSSAPSLRIGASSFPGVQTDTHGECWRFDADDLKSATTYTLSLVGADGGTIAEPWPLRTFPAPDATPDRLRVLIYTCAGGHDALTPVNGKTRFLPTPVRQQLLMRGLSFNPDAVIANGDHVYWDLEAPRASKILGASAEAIAYAGKFVSKLPVLGTANETFLKRAAGQQIAPLYATLCRSTPVFFIQDDHDYFDNDEADDTIITFPPRHWMLSLARATQSMYFPEFLPDLNRPRGLPGSSAPDRPTGVSEAFGTLRFGRLTEILLYDVRRSTTLAGPSAVFVDRDVEDWLKLRLAERDIIHVVNVPSNPPGWSAGKWGEWYPDVLDTDGKLTIDKPKPYWQAGWLAQHDRLITAMSSMTGRIPLVISGDLHAIGEGRIIRTGNISLEKNPVLAVLAGPIGTGDIGWPSAFRGIGPMPSRVLDVQEALKPIEENGFTLVDFTRDSITLRYFRWKFGRDTVESIATLEPFRTTELKRPG